jgi:bla regulator protein BlaR1
MIVSALADHLWQSTWFACAAWLLTLLVRKDAARIRYWIWLAASSKFLVPFALLTSLGSQFVLQVDDERALLPFVQHVAAPLTGTTISVEPLDEGIQRALLATWMLVSLALLGRWLVGWLHTRALVRRSFPCDIAAPIAVRCSDRVSEPSLVGLRDPVLLMPVNLLSKLTPAQLEAVIAHETWHARRRDNLAAALHSLVEALFWFHPLVWWIGAKLVDEREHACDEGAIQDGSEPAIYAEAIVRVCKHSVESRRICIANAGGGDLSARIRSILSERRAPTFGTIRRGLLAAALLACVALPVAAGVTVIATSTLTAAEGARSIRVANDAGPTFIAAHDDSLHARNVSLRELISHAYAVNARDVTGDPRWLDKIRYDVDFRSDSANDPRQLVAELLKQQFNVELIVRPTVRMRAAD